MYRKHLVLVIVLAVFLSFMIGCSSDPKTLKLTPSKLDFGEVYLGDTSSIDVVLKNKFGKPVSITDIQFTLSNDFSITAGGALPIDLEDKAEHTITVTFEPSSNGEISGLMTFTHDASEKLIECNMVGIGVAVPRIELPVDNHDFGKRLVNTSVTLGFNINNVGTSDLTISNFNFTGTGAANYSIVAGGTTPAVITPGASRLMNVKFEPTTAGSYPATLEIVHDAVNEASPSTFTFAGEGVTTAAKIDLSESTPWDFGSVATTIPGVFSLEMSSIGSEDLTVTSILFATGTEFTLDHVENNSGNTVNLPQTVAIGDKITAFIKFAPAANQQYNDTMTIMHSGLYNPAPLKIALSGKGRNELTKTFSYTGAAQQWTVPAGVSAIKVTCLGAEGYQTNGGTKGLGGKTSATVPVNAGETIYINVGGKGSSNSGGFNGGGTCPYTYGGPGGGASDIRIGGSNLTDRIVVAGGGGGAGYSSGKGGNGGGLTGDNGTGGYNNYPGKGGTQTAGGGVAWSSCTPGTLGNGGKGVGNSLGGGGGGGGYYGGGGGFCSGGGGGSSYYDAPGNTDKATAAGANSGNGEVTFKY